MFIVKKLLTKQKTYVIVVLTINVKYLMTGGFHEPDQAFLYR